MKSKILLLLSPITISLTTSFIVSCSASNNKEEDQQNVDNPIAQDIINEKIKFSYLRISKTYFEIYKNDLNEISKIVYVDDKNNTSQFQNLKINIISIPNFNETTNELSFKYEIIDLDSNTKYQGKTTTSFNFVTDAEYEKECSKWVVNNIQIKEEYSNQRILDLFKETKSNSSFIDKYIDKEILNKRLIGIDYKISIPTQTSKPFNKQEHQFLILNLNMFNKQDNRPIVIESTPYLKANLESQRDAFTIFNSTDLDNPQHQVLQRLDTNYLGELLIRSEQDVIESQVIDVNLSGKNILNTLDLRMFKEVTFGPNASFSSNKITNVIFNPQGTVNNLKYYLFSSNKISTPIFLPKKVTGFNYEAFDLNVTIKGIDSLNDVWNKYYDASTNDLDLRKVNDTKESELIISIFSHVNERELKTFNKVYLPSSQYISTKINKGIICNELILFAQETEWNIYMTNWKAENIIIPSSLILLDRSRFNSSSNIKREINANIAALVNNNTLTVNKSKSLIWDNLDKLDKLFYGATNVEVNKVIIDVPHFDKEISSQDNLEWHFLKPNSTVTFKNNVESININSFKSIKDFCRQKKFNFQREKFLNNQILSDSKELNLFKLYEYATKDIQITTNQYLIGYEEYISTINLEGIDKIKESTFADLNEGWSNLNVNIDNIKIVEQNAFKNSSIKINQTNFQPLQIFNSAFYNSQLTGVIDLSLVTSLEPNAFYGTRITSISNLSSNLKIIPNGAFQNCRELQDINLSNTIQIENNAFYNCTKLKNVVSLERVEKNIGDNAFYNCSALTTEIILNNSVQLGNNSFYGCAKISSFKNFNLSKHNLISVFGSSMNIANILNSNNQEITDMEIYNEVNYNSQTKVLDLTNFSFNDKSKANYLSLLFNKFHNQSAIINEMILPSEMNISSNFKKLLSRNITINKLTWISVTKKISSSLSSLFNNAKILSINNDFFVGSSSVPRSFLYDYPDLQNNQINLSGIEKIESQAFNRLKQSVEFINTNNVNEIQSKSFNEKAKFNITTNVKLAEDAFTKTNIINDPNYEIKRPKIFTNENIFSKVYNEQTKVLDFTKATREELDSILAQIGRNITIGDYLNDGDVETIILPETLIIINKLISNLGTVNSIKFNYLNEVIEEHAFNETIIKNKPNKNETHILLDLANFFSIS